MDLIGMVSGMKNLKLEGLMTIPPFFDNPETARPFFRELRELRDEAEKDGFQTAGAFDGDDKRLMRLLFWKAPRW